MKTNKQTSKQANKQPNKTKQTKQTKTKKTKQTKPTNQPTSQPTKQTKQNKTKQTKQNQTNKNHTKKNQTTNLISILFSVSSFHTQGTTTSKGTPSTSARISFSERSGTMAPKSTGSSAAESEMRELAPNQWGSQPLWWLE